MHTHIHIYMHRHTHTYPCGYYMYIKFQIELKEKCLQIRLWSSKSEQNLKQNTRIFKLLNAKFIRQHESQLMVSGKLHKMIEIL